MERHYTLTKVGMKNVIVCGISSSDSGNIGHKHVFSYMVSFDTISCSF